MKTIKVRNMKSSRGNYVPNQFIIDEEDIETGFHVERFQSYGSTIAKRCRQTRQVTIDKCYWDYSATTGKYRNEFLGEGIAETRRKIADGTYLLELMN